MNTKKWVIPFHEGNAKMKALLGGKGAGVAEMTRAGVPVPPGFTITTETCRAYFRGHGELPVGLWDQVVTGIKALETQTGRVFGGVEKNVYPLLVSVRSGAQVSMPGMMDTVLNLGLNPDTLVALAEVTHNPRFAHDAYRRFIQLYSKIVLELDSALFEHALEAVKGTRSDAQLTVEELQGLIDTYLTIVLRETGMPFPTDPYVQLKAAIRAVFRSWNGKRAIDYRRHHKISDDLGTAVNVQAMVFGNFDDNSATGVAFTRNPNTGVRELFGEYLVNAQGEDVVAGIRTPQPIAQMAAEMPTVYAQLLEIATQLELHYGDMQDIEFTVERGHLWLLQTRNGKRTGQAAFKIAVDLVHEGIIDKGTAIQQITPDMLDSLLHPVLDPEAVKGIIPFAKGLAASPGAVRGRATFDPARAEIMAEAGDPVILIRTETSPEDLHGMIAAKALLTARGGLTSHAAVVARSMGKACVVGAEGLHIDYAAQTATSHEVTIHEGDWLTLDGKLGQVYTGKLRTIEAGTTPDFQTVMQWVDEVRQIRVLANADTPIDAHTARKFGAEGIGLCRTEHMFFEEARIRAMRQMILAETTEARESALALLEPIQQDDFAGIFREMDGFPVIIRTLDPPLHEFLPTEDTALDELCLDLNVSPQALRTRVEELHESNPMLGFRGCRLGLLFPEITRMQARAIFRAAAEVQAEGVMVFPKVMIPLVATPGELAQQKAIVIAVADEVQRETGQQLTYQVGTMIELPRAALMADEIAEEAEFFSFGTNDLTQTTLGLSRDDSGRFLPEYVARKFYKEDPFKTIDQAGVGQLVRMGFEKGRAARHDLEVGICGEHGGDPESIKFFYGVGLDYVSCSPYRVPLARLVAAQVSLQHPRYTLTADVETELVVGAAD
jgi:pyruvate,orthophosphate dikinase